MGSAVLVVACGDDDTTNNNTTNTTGNPDGGTGNKDSGPTSTTGSPDAGPDVTTTPITPVDNTSYTVGGSVTGLDSGTLVLENNNGDDLSLTASGAYNFHTPVANNGGYAVTVKTQPAGHVCTVDTTHASGTVSGQTVTNIGVSCVKTYTISGSIAGGLSTTGIVIKNTLTGSTENATVTGTTFTFPTGVASGATYAVTVPTSPTEENCTVTTGGGNQTMGTANVNNIVVTCRANVYSLGGTISGAVGTGLVIKDTVGAATESATIAGTTFTFPTMLAKGTTYSIAVTSSPTDQDCSVTTGAGPTTMPGAAVTSAVVTCTTKRKIGGTVSGLVGANTISLTDNGGDQIDNQSNGTFTFGTKVTSYDVEVASQPTLQWCTASSNKGTVGNADVSNVSVSCDVCAEANEGGDAILTCATGLVIKSFSFVDYGLPDGTCGSYTQSTADTTIGFNPDGTPITTKCNSPADHNTSATAKCIGQGACTVNANNTDFTDPCSGTGKRIRLQATCGTP